jgi:tRNA-Thr(GGU) m(6)t(6)A37 methyltransferase TsaA
MNDTTRHNMIRPGEAITDLPEHFDASVYFIGHIRTPFIERSQCPRQGDREAGPECRIELDPRWRQALTGIARYSELQILYWMNFSRRDLLIQAARSREATIGTFAIRSPARPNPIASSIVKLLRVEESALIVRGLDCLDKTPLIDIKPNYDAPRVEPQSA